MVLLLLTHLSRYASDKSGQVVGIPAGRQAGVQLTNSNSLCF